MRLQTASTVRASAFRSSVELGEDLLDRIEIRRVGRQEQETRAGRADQLPNLVALVRAEIVHDDDVAGLSVGTSTCST